jgi:hypothetical protein
LAVIIKECLWFYILRYFEYRQIWLNSLMDYCHLSNLTKLKTKIGKKHWLGTSW